MIKHIIIFLSIILTVILVGCSIIKSLPSTSINKKSYISEIGNEIVRCIKTKDKEGLNNLFCDKVKGTEYLNRQIGYIFNYIDENGGVAIEEGIWKYPFSHGSYDGSGFKSIQYYACEYDGLVSINNKQYYLRFTTYQCLKKHQEYEGIHCIYFIEKVSNEIRNKILLNQEKGTNVKRYLCFDLINTNYQTYKDESILPNELYFDEVYEIPDNLEDDR